VIGFDCERRPSRRGSLEPAAVLQLASRKKIYLVDMQTLRPKLDDDDWQRLIGFVFGNAWILKLGYGIKQDVEAIELAIPNCKGLVKM